MVCGTNRECFFSIVVALGGWRAALAGDLWNVADVTFAKNIESKCGNGHADHDKDNSQYDVNNHRLPATVVLPAGFLWWISVDVVNLSVVMLVDTCAV